MYRWRMFCVLVAMVALSGCTATDSQTATSPSPSSTPRGTHEVRVQPWTGEVPETPLPTESVGPDKNNFCDSSPVTDRPDAYKCIWENTQADFCIANPASTDEYACMDRDLSWHILRGIERSGIPSSKPLGPLGAYVYLKLTDGTMCFRSGAAGPPQLGDYVSAGVCSDKTDYWTRFEPNTAPSDDSSPFGGGTTREPASRGWPETPTAPSERQLYIMLIIGV